MKKIMVKADTRSENGKGSARSLRGAGIIPAVFYSGGSSTPIKLNAKEMTKLIYSGVGEHALITIQLNDNGTKAEHPVLIKDYQSDPVSEELLHVDFMEVSLKDKIHVTVQLVIAKAPVGLKKGGILLHRMRDIEVECLPTQIPEKIEIDASSVDIGHSLHVSDLPEMEGVRVVSESSEVVLAVTAPTVEAEPEEGAAEVKEPELVKAKGKEAEESDKEEK